jgi:hypothetical protein
MAVITINSQNLYGWQGNSSNVALQIKCDATFTANSGNIVMATSDNPASLGSFYQLYTCTVSGTTLTIPAVTLDSTSDSSNNPSATYSAHLYDQSTNQTIQAYGTSFGVNPDTTPTTWANIFSAE